MHEDIHLPLYEYVKVLRCQYYEFVDELGSVMTEQAYIRARVMNELELAIRQVAEGE